MKVGIIVDGQAEFRSLPKLLPRVESGHVILNPIYADIQPLAPIKQIVLSVTKKWKVLLSQNVEIILILLDLEDRDVCPGAWAMELESALNKANKGYGVEFKVVVKNSCYENWLVSDMSVFHKMPKRFKISRSDERAISPNKSDKVNALGILKKSIQGNPYDKIRDAIQIMNLAQPLEMGANSRSFRRFLRVVGHPSYDEQSISPHKSE